MGSAIRSVTNIVAPGNQILGQTLGGTGSNSGILGLGQYRTDGYGIDRSAFDATGQEKEFTDALYAQSMGKGGPSAAELQLKQGADLAANNAFALAVSQRGVNPAMALRLAQSGGAQAVQQANQQAGVMRAQEQLNAQGLLASTLESQRNARGQREQLASGNFLGTQGLNQAGYEGAAGRRQQFVKDASQGIARMAGGMNEGGMVPGKAVVKGDSIKNDIVPVNLSPGELVVPRSIVEDGPEAIKSFAEALLKKKGPKNGKQAS